MVLKERGDENLASKTRHEPVDEYLNMAEEAIGGRERAEAEVAALKQELDEASKQRVIATERLSYLDAALKECVHQLSSLQEEQASRDFEKLQKKLEDKLSETSKKLASLTVDNGRLVETLQAKGKLIENLSKRKYQVEAELNLLMSRLDSMEKENAFLRYEFRVLEKELEIRNEEREYNRRVADASHKQHSESLKKITRLEDECRRLHLLVQKRGKLNTRNGGLVVRDPRNSPQVPRKRINFLIDRLCNMEEENMILKETQAEKEAELQSSRISFALMASKLAQIEAEHEELLKHRKYMELSNMSLMDDFAEIEKLAIISLDTPLGSSYVSSDANGSSFVGKELVPVVPSSLNDSKRETESTGKSGDYWIQDVLRVILEQKRVSKRSLSELLEDINIVLDYMSHVHENTEQSSRDEIKKNVRNMGLKDDFKNVESTKKEWEARLNSETEKTEALRIQLREMEQSIEDLKTEVEISKESKGIIEDQLENQRLINEDLNSQLAVAKTKLHEVSQRFSSLEMQLEDKYNCYEELEATCLELQLQLEIVTKNEIPKYEAVQDEKKLQTGWEMTTASLKLTECQETILHLGKQLKALAPPMEVALFNKVFSTTTTNNQTARHRSSLRDRMLADDDFLDKNKIKSNTRSDSKLLLLESREAHHSSRFKSGYSNASMALAIVPSKKRGVGVGFLRKLLWRRKKGSTKKTALALGV